MKNYQRSTPTTVRAGVAGLSCFLQGTNPAAFRTKLRGVTEMTSGVAKKLTPDEQTLKSIQDTFLGLRPARVGELADALKSNQVRFAGLGFVTPQVVFDRPFTCPTALTNEWMRQMTLKQSGGTLPDGAKFLSDLDGALQLTVLSGYLAKGDIQHPSLLCDFFVGSDKWMLELVVSLRPNLRQLVFLPFCNQFRFVEWV